MDGIPELVRVGYFIAPNHDSITPHRIGDGYEYVELVLRGKTRFVLEGREREFGSSTMFWHLAGESTIHLNDPENPYECLCMLFKTMKKKGFSRIRRVSAWGRIDDAQNFSDEMLSSFHSPGVEKRLLGNYAYSRVCWEAFSHSRRKIGGFLPLVLEKFIEIADGEEASGMGVDEIAERCSISVPHLHALARRHFGSGPHAILLERRLSEARRLLLTSELGIKEIAGNCGFSHIETFYRAFGRKYGVSPGAMRRKGDPRSILRDR